MKVQDIMIPWKGEKQLKDGVNGNCSIYSLKDCQQSWVRPIVEVTNDQGNKIGEIDREMLSYLIRAADTNMFIITDIIDKFHEGVVVIDTEGRIFYANAAYSSILKVPVCKIIGKKMQQIEPEAEILNVLKTKKTIIKKSQYVKTVDKFVSTHIFPIEKDGELRAVASIFTDATEVVRLGQQIERANEIALTFRLQAEEQNELKKLNIVGRSPSFIKAVSQTMTVAKTDASVLVKGENGVGKELIAKLIHANSERKSQPFIIVNCAAIPENLIESELFGYEEGTFTGAKSGGRMGKFELADGGTLFLDEIGDMPLTMQPKLLRVLQEGEIEKIGRKKNVPVNVRIIAASNQPIEKMVHENKFRKDLYYRINIVEITVPPLRERGEDIGILANHFLQKFNKKYRKSISFSSEVLSFFHSYGWPGNVRELQHCIEYAVIMCLDDYFDLTHLPPHFNNQDLNTREDPVRYNYGTLKEAVEIFEKRVIQEAISVSQNNRSRAMEMLGLSRRTFYRKLKEYEIDSGIK